MRECYTDNQKDIIAFSAFSLQSGASTAGERPTDNYRRLAAYDDVT